MPLILFVFYCSTEGTILGLMGKDSFRMNDSSVFSGGLPGDLFNSSNLPSSITSVIPGNPTPSKIHFYILLPPTHLPASKPGPSCSKNKPPQIIQSPTAVMTHTRLRARVGGTMTGTSLKATQRPAGTMPKQLEVRRVGTTKAATVVVHTMSPAGRTTASEWNRVVWVMMTRTR